MKRILLSLIIVLMAIPTFAQEKRTGVKSGAIEYRMEAFGEVIMTSLFFDDYGTKSLSLSEIDTPMGSTKMGQLYVDGKNYTIHYDQNLVQEQPSAEQLNFMNLTQEVIEKYKLQEVGKEKILDKECVVYTYQEDYPMQGKVNVKAWVWQGIPLKSQMEFAGTSIINVATSISVDIEVDPLKFEVPKF